MTAEPTSFAEMHEQRWATILQMTTAERVLYRKAEADALENVMYAADGTEGNLTGMAGVGAVLEARGAPPASPRGEDSPEETP